MNIDNAAGLGVPQTVTETDTGGGGLFAAVFLSIADASGQYPHPGQYSGTVSVGAEEYVAAGHLEDEAPDDPHVGLPISEDMVTEPVSTEAALLMAGAGPATESDGMSVPGATASSSDAGAGNPHLWRASSNSVLPSVPKASLDTFVDHADSAIGGVKTETSPPSVAYPSGTVRSGEVLQKGSDEESQPPAILFKKIEPSGGLLTKMAEFGNDAGAEGGQHDSRGNGPDNALPENELSPQFDAVIRSEQLFGRNETGLERQTAATRGGDLAKANGHENPFTVIRRGSTHIEVHLKPEGLGKIELEVNLQKGVIYAHINTSDPDGKEMIERNMDRILEMLEKEGLDMGGLSISLGNKKRQKEDEEKEIVHIEEEFVKTEPRAASAEATEGKVSIFI